MKPVARGALLYSLLPPWPAVTSAYDLLRLLRARGIRTHVRTIQRDLEDMPARLVRRRAKAKPFGWARVTLTNGIAKGTP